MRKGGCFFRVGMFRKRYGEVLRRVRNVFCEGWAKNGVDLEIKIFELGKKFSIIKIIKDG